MTMQYEIDKDANVTYITFAGTIDDQILISQMGKVVGDPQFGLNTSMLHDYRRVTEFQVTPLGMNAVQEMMIHLKGFEASRKLALVAPNTLARRLAWMCHGLHAESPEDVAIFQNMAEARRWLTL
ncbi:MAG: hypothetical protein JXA21_07590 [Anaerolineae bacterium]|nr:hypothetical protein [Anaerolineae bacterium]